MSFWKLYVFLSNLHFSRLAFTSFLILSVSLPASSFAEETQLKLHRHLILITKKTIVLEKEIDALRNKSETKENLQKIIDMQTQIDRLNLNFDSRATNLSLEDSSLKKKEKSPWTKQLEDITAPPGNSNRSGSNLQRKKLNDSFQPAHYQYGWQPTYS